jgi:hypothetical protein
MEAHKPSSVKLTFTLVLINSILWGLFAFIVIIGAHPSYRNFPLLRWSMAGISLGIAVTLTLLWVYLRRRSKAAFFITVAGLTAFTIVIFMDDFGFADFMLLIINTLPLILLIKDRRWFLQKVNHQS